LKETHDCYQSEPSSASVSSRPFGTLYHL
jgi:hypothetical protein